MRKLVRPENAVWADLLCNHDRDLRPADYLLDKEQLWHETRTHDEGLQRFHLLLMGGDQIYFDSIWEDIAALKQWVGLARAQQLEFKVSQALEDEIEAYYFGRRRARHGRARSPAWTPPTPWPACPPS